MGGWGVPAPLLTESGVLLGWVSAFGADGLHGVVAFAAGLGGVVWWAQPLEFGVVGAVDVVGLAAVAVEPADPPTPLPVGHPLALAACCTPGACALLVPVTG